MGFFSKLFGSQKEEATQSQPDNDGRNRQYEDQLAKHFGLKFAPNGWSFEGVVNKDYVQHLGDTELCLKVLQLLQPKLGFDQICIVSSKPSVLVVCNSKTPFCMLTSLNASGISTLIATIVKANGKQIYEYQGAWLLKMK